jgi:hypothetical protein
MIAQATAQATAQVTGQAAAQPAAQRGAERLALAGALGVWELAGLFSVLIAIGVTFLTGWARRTRAPAR